MDLHAIWNAGERIIPLEAGFNQPLESHLAQYTWARSLIASTDTVVDWGCGVGYGAKILAPVQSYLGVDCAEVAIEYAQQTYGAYGAFRVGDMLTLDLSSDVGICLVAMEHLRPAPPVVLTRFLTLAPTVLFSVSYNEPYSAGHHHHFQLTEETFADGPWDIAWYYRDDEHGITQQKRANCGNLLGCARRKERT